MVREEYYVTYLNMQSWESVGETEEIHEKSQ